MALSQLVTKTYGRRARQADNSQAARAFDEVFKDVRPPVRATSTAEKWGNASFTKISHPESPPMKRKLTSSCDSSDPFSFDSDDEGNSKKQKKCTTKVCEANQKLPPIVVHLGKSTAGRKERENLNKNVARSEILKSTSKSTKDNKKLSDHQKSAVDRCVLPTVSVLDEKKRTSHHSPSIEGTRQSSSLSNGLSFVKRVLNNGSDKKIATFSEPVTDRTLQLECYGVTDDDKIASHHSKSNEGLYNNEVLEKSYSTSSSGTSSFNERKKTAIHTETSVCGDSVFTTEKCEKQAQLFVSRFARLFGSGRTGLKEVEKPDKTQSTGTVSDTQDQLRNNNNRNNNTTLNTTDKVKPRSSQDFIMNASGKNSLRGSRSSNLTKHCVPESASCANHGTTEAFYGSDCDVVLLSCESADENNSAENVACFSKAKSLSSKSIASEKYLHPSSQPKSVNTSKNSFTTLKDNSPSSVCSEEYFPISEKVYSEEFVPCSEKLRLRKSLSNGVWEGSQQITPDFSEKRQSSIVLKTSSRKLLSGSKGAIRSKAVYNPRQWNDPDELISDGGSQTSSSSTKPGASEPVTVYDDFDMDSGLSRDPTPGGNQNVFTKTHSTDRDSCGSSSGSGSKKFMVKKELKPAYEKVLTRHARSRRKSYYVEKLEKSSDAASDGFILRSEKNFLSNVKATIWRWMDLLYTVVHNVKQAHECQEYGETQEFCDDIDYILDGLRSSQPVATRCLSSISLASKCSTSAFRMHIRAHGTLAKVFAALPDALDHPSLSLCTSAIMFMMSRDHLVMDIDKSSLQLMLRLLNADSNSKAPGDDLEYNKIRQRLHSICSSPSVTLGRNRSTVSIALEDTTPGNLAMETLLTLTSKQAGDWFKDSLRSLGGLDQIINTVCRCINILDNESLNAIEDMPADSETLKQLQCVERCIRVLESSLSPWPFALLVNVKVSLLNPANQEFLYSYKASSFIGALDRLLNILIKFLPRTKVDVVEDETILDKEQPNITMSRCLVNTLRLLFNITHDNESASAATAQMGGMLDTLMTCTLRSPGDVPASQRFDLIVLGLGLLTNLIENSSANRSKLMALRSLPPFDHPYPLPEHTVDCLEALGMMFSSRYEAAKLVEEEQDAEIEEAERRQKASLSSGRDKLTGKTLIERHQQAGEWCESDSGMLWNPAETSTLDDSGDGLAALQACRQEAAAMAGNPICTSSQEDDENYTKVLHTAGKHMEDSIVAAYIALLVGTVVQHNMNLAESVRDTLPGFSFRPMVQMLSKFLGFMNLTRGSGTGASKSIQKIIEVLEAC